MPVRCSNVLVQLLQGIRQGAYCCLQIPDQNSYFLSYMRCCSRPKRFVWDLLGLLGWELSFTQKACCGVRLTRFNTLRMSSMHALASGPPMTPKAHKQLACCLWLKLCRHGTLAQVTVKPCEHS